MKGVRFCFLGLCIGLSSCKMGPNYCPPEPCIPEVWTSESGCVEAVPLAWWEELNDPLLSYYIEQAACYNNDVLTAEATIFQARALRQMAASQLFPQLNGNLFASRTYFSRNGPLFAIGAAGTSDTPGLPFTLQVPQLQNIFTSLIDASWELDLFGRVRREVEVTDALIGSAIEQKNDVLITVIGEVARNYIDLRSAQQQGVLIEESICLLEQEATIVRQRWERGLDDRLQVDAVEANLATLKATLPPICAQIYQYMYAISVLTGELPEALFASLSPIAPLPQASEEILCGLRSDLIRRRPDVRRAERNLAAATASIGVAVASFFPTFSLTADLGLQALQFKELFRLSSNTWSIGAMSSVPLFQGGKLVGRLRLTEGVAMGAAYAYQQTVLNALEEAESALITYTRERESVDQLQRAVGRYAALNALSAERFEKGLVSLTEVIDSGRQLNSSQQNLLTGETAVLTDLVTLYKALGGGWELFSEWER
ncbi:MAG: Toluene efflux pump outer membrane protein TtgF [Chlamydiales bacterium]|nr:Toluene efflux pump outer membrane protein TtgF [Chlamydiales bacterium]